ncbi:hypothetical protein CJF32_00001768 [Rutstroemia sp. NJR-2017a WRK4]|nr:hypothetical protein CJF32_00001768 [Rutstroemia sp. NJR-2017a WRK4]
MSCTPFKAALSRFGSKCAESLGLKQKPSKPISISAPFNFQEGPAVMFPGYSEDDISLMKEKAIASTAYLDAALADAWYIMQGKLAKDVCISLGLSIGSLYHQDLSTGV